MTPCDVLVVGGGPAGSTCATLLARAGHRVVVLEKERFPRFHVGESLLPVDLPIFARLGLGPTEETFVRKAGAEFLDERTGRHTIYHFADGLPGTPSHAWQVERSLFDQRLLDLARAAGAEVREGERAVDVTATGEAVEVKTRSGAGYRARYLIDATGQDALLARRARTVEPIRGFGIGAVFRHVEGLSVEAAEELYGTGNIKILILEDGWSWVIPLRGRKLSFGVVRREAGIGPELLDAVHRSSPLLSRLSAGATLGEAHLIRNFSYASTRPSGPRWCAIGDAACFLDPVFSSGVTLAMVGAERTADALGPALAAGTESDPDLTRDARLHMQHAYGAFGALIHRFYHTRMVDHLFFCEDPEPEMRAGLITMLAGDVWRDDNRFQRALLGGRRGTMPVPAQSGR